MSEQQYTHWKLLNDDDQILWLIIDRADQAVNSLNREVISEFEVILDSIDCQKTKGVVITSGKARGFVAGADITQFSHLKTEDQAYELIRQAQLVLDKLEALTIPTVALINGFCLGGGYELALACRYRVALDDPKTKIGLPEIKLGIHPGWGGSVRLPKLVGAINSMQIILPGAAVAAKKAKKLGMVDAVVPERTLKRAARFYVLKQPKPHQPSFLQKLTNVSVIRPLLAKTLYKQLAAKKVNKNHYPAPFAVVKNWVRDFGKTDAMENEAKSIAKLMLTDTAHSLLRVFFLQNQMKEVAKGPKFKVQHVHVIGAGTMGGDIAAWCALRGMRVTLQDQSPEKIAPAIKRAYKLFNKKLRKPMFVQQAMDRLQPDVKGLGVRGADVIIEAIFENLEVKQQLFKSIEPQIKPTAILATNTSSIPLEEIGSVLADPNRLIGIHFFNPVAMMPLVEIVRHDNTPDDLVQRSASFVTQIARSPLVVKSSPGFLVNRVLMPYLMEAMACLEDGIPATQIDKAALNFGMPMGPIELADKVGLDVCLSVAENLIQHFGGSVSQRLIDMVKRGELGVKSGKGFYEYKEGKIVRTNNGGSTGADSDLTDRLIFRMLNEAIACLHERVIDDPDLLDAGMIFGTGFAPFRGGPTYYARQRGVKEIVTLLGQFSTQYGERFKPRAGWNLLVEKDMEKTIDNNLESNPADGLKDVSDNVEKV